MYSGTYDPALVLTSLLVAILAAYTTLNLVRQVASAEGEAARWWLAGGAFALGVGIWSMHFIGMLAFSLPIPLGYDPLITFASLMLAIGASAFALWLVTQPNLPWSRLAFCAVLLGGGVAGMHYMGMAAMQMAPGITYDPGLFILSIAIAIGAAGAALWIGFRLRQQTHHVRRSQAIASVVMGVAVCGMHYTGMAAAEFPLGSMCGAAKTGLTAEWLALFVIILTVAILAVALIVSLLSVRLGHSSALARSLAEANRELSRLALHDHLTKLPNRVLMEDRLTREILAANRDGGQVAVMFLDLDGFKAINDSLGHQAGDLLLVEVTRRIRDNTRAKDTAARIGGDEFVLLACVGEPADAATLADKLVTALRQPFEIAGHPVSISASIGIAMYPGDGKDQHELVINADAAMYHAKDLGRDRYCFFAPSMNANVHEQLLLSQDLRMALVRGEFILHYQPKFAAVDGRLIGAEALLRWIHPSRGMIAPDAFIPIAEKTGLIVQIGEWVLDEACRQMSQWQADGHADWTIAINLSALQFCDAALIPTVCHTLDRHALDPRCLVLEVTESTAMRNADDSLLILGKLHDMGVGISLDDFGTGYSSLLQLKRLPVSELKIDRGFVRYLEQNREDSAIVTAIVALGKTLHLRIVAEGVENVAQQEFLTLLGCDELQGYLLGRPMSAKHFIDAIAPATSEITVAQTG